MIKFLKQYGTLIAIILIAIIGWSFSLFYNLSSYEQQKAEYLKTERQLLESEISSIIRTYEEFSSFIFETLLNTPEVIDLIADANHAEGEEQQLLREQLYEMLLKTHVQLKRYHFRQLQFHLRNGDSFLRFHAPGLYGDNLFEIRETIRIANTEERYVSGFEEGRVLGGYRFVYPLNRDGEHLGTVELPISLAAVIDLLKDLYPEKLTVFVIDEEVVDFKVFKELQDNYEFSFLEGYLFDSEVLNNIIAREFDFELYLDDAFTSKISEQARPHLSSGYGFSYTLQQGGVDYLVQFIPVRNFSKETVGYFISTKEDSYIAAIRSSMRRELLLITILFAVTMILLINIERDRRLMKQLASTDKLTGLYNRHKFTHLAAKEINRCERYEHPFSIIMIDIDDFKVINDQFGHVQGDQVLKNLGAVLQSGLRDSDILARWGGEEFIILMPETTADQAVSVADRLRKAFEDFNHDNLGSVTISLGVAEKKDCKMDLNTLIHRADQALYKAKNKGKNRIEVV